MCQVLYSVIHIYSYVSHYHLHFIGKVDAAQKGKAQGRRLGSNRGCIQTQVHGSAKLLTIASLH